MSKGGKMFDAIMITIIIIASLNYADYIKVDLKLMMVLLAIALYVTAKQTQKPQKSQKVEPLDGSTVAFDKEAFVNLNAIVNELVKKDSVTIPGNLIVKGELKVQHPDHAEDDKANFRIKVTKEGVAKIGNQHAGEINWSNDDGWLRCYNWDKPGEYKKGIAATEFWTERILHHKCKIEFNGTHGINMRHGDEWVCVKDGVGTDIHRVRAHHLIGVAWGTSDGVWHHSASGKISTQLNPNHELGFMIHDNQWQMYVNGNGIGTYVHVGAKQNLNIDGATDLKGSLNAHGQVICNTTTVGALTVNGDIKASGNASANAFLYKDNGNQGLLFNQGDRQIRLASGTANAMLDFDGSKWLLSYAANQYYQFSNTNIDWLKHGKINGVRWT